MDDAIKLASFNVNGLNGKVKRNAVFSKLKKMNSIIFMQETHSAQNAEAVWKSEWGNDIFFSHGSTSSRGVAILFPSKLEYKIQNTIRDDEGRFLLLTVTINCKDFVLVNVYAPTRDHRQDQLYFIDYVKRINQL